MKLSKERNEDNTFVGFEYRDVTVKKTMQPIYTDNYKNFGWTFEGDNRLTGNFDFTVMKFKRNRKIRNKAELTRLQRQFDGHIKEIIGLENSKRTKAAVIAYGVGILGTAFMTCSVFAITMGNVAACIIMGIPGFLGWIIPYLIFKSVSQKRAEEVNPLIIKKYDELYEICEKANSLLV